MAKFTFSDIEDAFMYVGSAMYGMNSAVLCKDTGKILYRSDMAGIDEIADEEDIDWDQCVEVPHKNDLDTANFTMPQALGKAKRMRSILILPLSIYLTGPITDTIFGIWTFVI
jgi:hypothetical protein